MASEFEQNWLSRSRGVLRRRRFREANEPLPLTEQTSLPSDYSAHFEEPGFTLGHALPDAAAELQARQPHRLDGKKGVGSNLLATAIAILARLGMHNQTLTNFRVDVPQNTDATIVPFNAARSYLFLVNTGGNEIRIAFDRAADNSTGVPIPSGGFYEPILGTISSVHATSAAVGQQLVIVEGFYSRAGVGG